MYREGKTLTRDVGGTSGTKAFADAVLEAMEAPDSAGNRELDGSEDEAEADWLVDGMGSGGGILACDVTGCKSNEAVKTERRGKGSEACRACSGVANA